MIFDIEENHNCSALRAPQFIKFNDMCISQETTPIKLEESVDIPLPQKQYIVKKIQKGKKRAKKLTVKLTPREIHLERNRIAAAKYRNKKNKTYDKVFREVMSKFGELPEKPEDNAFINTLKELVNDVPLDDKRERNRLQAMIYRERKALFRQKCIDLL